jgi:hypothetical protein
MKKILFAIIYLLTISHLHAQQDSTIRKNQHRGQFYFYWGYNRAYFSSSNLHFNGPNYDFTLYNLKAKDRPERFGWVYFNPGTLSIPQYNLRLGYFITERFHLSLGMDHMKYVVNQGQTTRISGVVLPAISEKYAGSYLNQPIDLQPDLLIFEHTNGFNLVSLDFEWLQPLYNQKKTSPPLACSWNIGAGGIWVVTKTDVRVFSDGLDNDFHVAGYSLVGKMGPRLEWRKRWFLSAEGKFGYASLPAVLIKNNAPEIGDHNLTFFEWNVTAGIRFGKRY